MDRRMFLNGLFGVAGVAALGGLVLRSAEAMPVAPLDVSKLDKAPGNAPANAQAQAGTTPDGTEIEKAQYYYGPGWRRRRYWRRRRRRYWRRRYGRLVCRTRWTRYGWVRRCFRVYY